MTILAGKVRLVSSRADSASVRRHSLTEHSTHESPSMTLRRSTVAEGTNNEHRGHGYLDVQHSTHESPSMTLRR